MVLVSNEENNIDTAKESNYKDLTSINKQMAHTSLTQIMRGKNKDLATSFDWI